MVIPTDLSMFPMDEETKKVFLARERQNLTIDAELCEFLMKLCCKRENCVSRWRVRVCCCNTLGRRLQHWGCFSSWRTKGDERLEKPYDCLARCCVSSECLLSVAPQHVRCNLDF